MRVDTINERLGLFLRMIHHAGVDPLASAPATGEAELRAAAQRCLGCRDGEACREWLAGVAEDAAPPAFCRNADHFREWSAPAAETAPDR